MVQVHLEQQDFVDEPLKGVHTFSLLLGDFETVEYKIERHALNSKMLVIFVYNFFKYLKVPTR